MPEQPRYRAYHVIKSKTRKGKTVFYVRIPDQKTGKPLKECCSGQTSRTAATRWAEVELE